MTNPWRHCNRRQFLERAAWVLPAFHGGLALAGPAKPGDGPAKPDYGSADVDPAVEFRELSLRTHRPEELRTFYREVLDLGVGEDDVAAAVFPTEAEVAGIGGDGLDLDGLPYRIRRAA